MTYIVRYFFCVAGKDVLGKKCGLITCCEEHAPIALFR